MSVVFGDLGVTLDEEHSQKMLDSDAKAVTSRGCCIGASRRLSAQEPT